MFAEYGVIFLHSRLTLLEYRFRSTLTAHKE